jgi:hypothetical protein
MIPKNRTEFWNFSLDFPPISKERRRMWGDISGKDGRLRR